MDATTAVPSNQDSKVSLPSWLLSPPTTDAVSPPISTQAQLLPLGDLTWKNFERLCLRLLNLAVAMNWAMVDDSWQTRHCEKAGSMSPFESKVRTARPCRHVRECRLRRAAQQVSSIVWNLSADPTAPKDSQREMISSSILSDSSQHSRKRRQKPRDSLGNTRVDSGRGQNRTLRPLSTFWPLVFAGEQDVGPPKG